MRSLVLTSILLFSFCVVGCATKQVVPVHVKTGDRTTLAFTGKGAAAGMMMDAFLGGAGVAIGIAIDEGIAKDIAANMSKPPLAFDIVSSVEKKIVTQKYSAQSYRVVQKSDTNLNEVVQVMVETYGFKSAAGEGDKVAAWIKIRFVEHGREVVINYPDEFESPASAELNEVKTNSKVASDLLNNAADIVLARYFIKK